MSIKQIIPICIIILLISFIAYAYHELNIQALEISDVEDQNEELLLENGELSEMLTLEMLLKMPSALDQHYEKFRDELLFTFTSKGDRGWQLFYVMQVLHDLGEYNETESCKSFLQTYNESCLNLTVRYLKDLCEFKIQGNESLDQIQAVYEFVDSYLYFVEDEWGFPRFPVETLVLGYGDCEDQAVAVSAMLETLGFETALSMIHDEENDLYHNFCLVKNSAEIGYDGTLLQSDEYPELGQIWFVLDPAYNHAFGKDPSWMNNYRDNGQIKIPPLLWNSTIVDVTEFKRISHELNIIF